MASGRTRQPAGVKPVADGRGVAARFRSSAGIIEGLHLYRLEARPIGAIWPG
jgi:hypothetical protein